MATLALVSISEYLRSSYEPDAEYVDGRIEERVMGELDHGDLQGALVELLRNKANRTYFKAIPEWRVQVSATRFRVPDIALRRADAPREQVATYPPLLCMEILSPEDTMRRTLVKVKDYLAMGVLQVWVFDTESRSVHVYDGKSAIEHSSGVLMIPGTPVTVNLEEVFSTLDQD